MRKGKELNHESAAMAPVTCIWCSGCLGRSFLFGKDKGFIQGHVVWSGKKRRLSHFVVKVMGA